MPHISFYYSLTEDARNWTRQVTAKGLTYGISSKERKSILDPEIQKLIKNKSQEEIYQIILAWLRQNKLWQKIVQAELRELKQVWTQVEKPVFDILADITEKPIYSKKFNCALTTHFLCPYDQQHNWFMVSAKSSLPQQLTNIAHELLHLQVSHYYKEKYYHKLGKQKWYLLQELITVILNDEKFSKVLPLPDQGYLNQQLLRQTVFKYWQKRQGFEEFLQKVTKLVVKK